MNQLQLKLKGQETKWLDQRGENGMIAMDNNSNVVHFPITAKDLANETPLVKREVIKNDKSR